MWGKHTTAGEKWQGPQRGRNAQYSDCQTGCGGLISVFASATAIASFTMTQQMGGDAELAGDIVVATSALCIVTMFAWSLLFKLLGAF